ncbi:MAG TPA: alpha-1,2-fucosyltransferase [Mucilaginibacter sp.]|jgi:hypothetical protein|nr:alpha-1,2-fucosyltransferase [Mucilaginibacter sp.]
MLSFSKLGLPHAGRLGNQLFQVAFITHFAKKFDIEYKIPYWKYAEYFDYKFNFLEKDISAFQFDLIIKEPEIGYHEDLFERYLPYIRSKKTDIFISYFQSYKYFTKQHALNVFRFNSKFKAIKINPSKCVAVSVRRGDFINHPHFNNIEADTFKKILQNFKNHKIFLFTDDFQYCKSEFAGPQYEFMEGLNDIEQLINLSQFELFVLSNSTFSYWGPMLNPKPKTVFYPLYMSSDQNLCKIYNSQYWPQEPNIYIPYLNPINKPVIN